MTKRKTGTYTGARFTSAVGMAVVGAASISLLVSGQARAQDVAVQPPVAAQPPAAAPPVATPPAPGDVQSLSRGTLLVTILAYDEQTGLQVPARNVVVRVESDFERPRYGVTDDNGVARLRLYAGEYRVVVTSAQYQRDEKTVVVRESTVGELGASVNFILYTRIDTEKVRLLYSLLDREELSNVTKRDRRFFNDIPLGIGNRQSLGKQLRSIPGFVEDSFDRVHPRGENALVTATYLDGVLLPQFAAGRVAQLLLPDTIEVVNARVGGLAPEFGGGSGAVLDLKTRRPSTTGRFLDFTLKDGEQDTSDFYLNFGNSIPGPGSVASRGPFKKFYYNLALSSRYTQEAVEAPRDGYVNPENYGASEVVYGKGTFDLGFGRTLTGLFNFSSGRNGIATRQGYVNPPPNAGGFGFLGESFVGQPSQENLFQTFRQKDNNSIVMLQGRSVGKKNSELVASVGVTSSTLAQLSQPGTRTQKQTALPNDNSVEYLTTALNDYEQLFFQFDFTGPEGNRESPRTHRIKAGIVYHNLDGLDSYQFIPQSQLALDELYALDPRLAPPSQTSAEIKMTGEVDSRGNKVVRTTGLPVHNPIVFAGRTGDYAAAYVQDTYKINPLFRMNFGVRYDSFSQKTTIRTTNPDYISDNASGAADRDSGSTSKLSPRINIAYISRYGPRFGSFLRPINILFKPLGLILNEQAILRLSYGKYFAAPELGQGYFLPFQRGTTLATQSDQAVSANYSVAPQPQTTTQLDGSIERQFGDVTFGKISIYSKDIKNVLTNRSVLTGLQSGMLSTYNEGDGIVDGIEVSLNTAPRFKNGSGLSAFLSFANSATKPTNANQRDNFNSLVRTTYYEYDQTSTISTGASYSLPNGGSIGLSILYGSGLYSSRNAPLPDSTSSAETNNINNSPTNLNNPVRVGGRKIFNEVNLRFATRPDFLYRTKDGRGLGLEFAVENLFDSVTRLNWRGPIAGNRYQLGRRIFVALTGKL